MVPMLARQRGLNFTPGSEYQYNNGAYNLLGSIVKHVSGQSLRAFADANIFKPLGMTSTHYRDDPAMILPYRASGYSASVTFLRRWALLVTRVHIRRSAICCWGNRTSQTFVSMQAQTVLTSGRTSAYGFGLAIRQYRGLRTIEHAGSDRGIATNAVRYPDQQLAVVVLCNLDTIDVNSLTRAMTDIHLADTLAARSPSSSAPPSRLVSLSDDELANRAGLYRSSSNTDRAIRISVRNGTVIARSFYGDDTDVESTPVSANRFRLPGSTNALEFVPATAVRPHEWHIVDNAGKQLDVLELVTSEPSTMDLRSSVGEYRSLEIDVTYTVALEGSGLAVRPPGRAHIVLQACREGRVRGRFGRHSEVLA